MERYAVRVALVTGANSGIGAATARALFEKGLKVVGLDKRIDMIKAHELKDAPGKLYPLQVDVSSEESILCAFKWIKENLGGVDVLINSAGVCGESLPTNEFTSIQQISPGLLKTEIFSTLQKHSTEALENMRLPMMESEDMADAVIYMLSQPPRVQVYDIILRPTGDLFC
ncbi:farnesol dehydrogenase-like [Schistocerca gregaria]|uniref:farnesol dehydrogenase-like n=1 Tax=Schistocerca gregaria TaxID=7010 RepID=UPI00211F1B6B|nr:farnesol dehydrogenase-like [Schistocerca gregaria]